MEIDETRAGFGKEDGGRDRARVAQGDEVEKVGLTRRGAVTNRGEQQS